MITGLFRLFSTWNMTLKKDSWELRIIIEVFKPQQRTYFEKSQALSTQLSKLSANPQAAWKKNLP